MEVLNIEGAPIIGAPSVVMLVVFECVSVPGENPQLSNVH